jgi:hypothetical protein
MKLRAEPLYLGTVIALLAVAYWTPPESTAFWAPAASWVRETINMARMIR